MATSFGTYSQWNNKFNPMSPICQWDDKVFICGEIRVRNNARAELCDTHGTDHDTTCTQCKRHKAALAEPPTCGKKWVGGDTCFDCLGCDALKLLMPRKEYLEYNNYTGPIPRELREFWDKKDKENAPQSAIKMSVRQIITGMGHKIPEINEKPVIKRVVQRHRTKDCDDPYMIGGWLRTED